MKRLKNKLAFGGIICVLAFFIVAAVIVQRTQSKATSEYKEFDAYIAVPGDRIDKENRIVKKIAGISKTNVNVEWLEGKSAIEKINNMITTDTYPDFLHGAGATSLLIEQKAFIPIDEYLDDYPNLKGYLTEKQWDSLRMEDGHIYFLPAFGVIHGQETLTTPSGEAFWIQKRVLEWAGFPEVKTLDQYFDLIESYLLANPETDGQKNIGFEILCDDWRFFCMENPPMFLAGYPNDGCAIVDKDTQKAAVYDTTKEARQYYEKLCEMYHKGVIDPETFTLNYDQYISRITKGNVLGFVDQYWQFMNAQSSLYGNGMIDRTYVPLAITADEAIQPNYNCTENNLNVGEGMGITVSCEDVEGALAFLDTLLTPEVMKLRYWGEEGIDYNVDENGVFYRTEEQRKQRENAEYLSMNAYSYGYFPAYEGLLDDGINTVEPSDQPGEFYANLSDYDKKVLDAYGYHTWTEFLGPKTEGTPWYPLYSCKENWPADAECKKASENMDRIKRSWLPKLIMSPVEEYEENWNRYITEYNETVNVDAYLEELNLEIQNRIQQ